MSLENAVRFLVCVVHDVELRAQAERASTRDLLSLGRARGLDFTLGELTQAVQTESGELRDEELDKASGGAGGSGMGSATDPNALVQFVLRESYLSNTQDLASYAGKVQSFNDAKKAIRDHLSRC